MKQKNWESLPLVLTAEQVALVLGVHVATIRKWRRAGKIRAQKLNNGKLIFDRDYIISIIKGGEV